MNGDNYWNKLSNFLSTHDFDVIQFQEVFGNHTVVGNLNTQIDCFEELKKLLKNTHKGELTIMQRYESNPAAYLANATFYKKEFTLTDINQLTLHKNPRPFPKVPSGFESVGRNLLHLELTIHDKNISFLNAHLAWAKTPKEEPHQTKQGKILLNYLKSVPAPFVFTGDFNLDPNQPLIKKLNKFAKNLTTKNNVMTTLNPNTHRAKMLFPPGVAVDYIFVTPDLTVKHFEIIHEDLSDHLGLVVTIEI